MTTDDSSSNDTKESDAAEVVASGYAAFLLHRCAVVIVYVAATIIGIVVFWQLSAEPSFSEILTLGAVLATLGTAIATLGRLWESDRLERVKTGISILYCDILKCKPWRRWPFLKRYGESTLFSRDVLTTHLHNPRRPLDVGSHVFKVDVPTVIEDFFDLPTMSNAWKLFRSRRASCTFFSRRMDEPNDEKTLAELRDGRMEYECLYDVWISILIFRVARYATHFGCGIVFATVALLVLRCCA